MNRPRLTAKELRHRYRQGERNFTGVDLSRESLRGLNLRDIDFSGADLSYTDIRGTCFANATLKKSILGNAKAGLQRRWIVIQLAVIFSLATLLSFISALIAAIFTGVFFKPSNVEKITVIPGVFLLLMVLGMFLTVAIQGTTFKAFRSIVALSAITIAVTILSVFVGAGTLAAIRITATAATVVISGAVAAAAAILVGGLVLSVITGAGMTAGVVMIAAIIMAGIIGAISGTVMGAVNGIPVTIVAFSGAGLSSYVAWHSLQSGQKFPAVRVFALAVGAVGGTSFSGADLTCAYFTQATLKNTNFADSHQQQTILTHVRWHAAQQLDFARLGTSILQDSRVRKLVITLNGVDQNFSTSLLRGANVAGANLARANLCGSVLSDAMLTDANLQAANLTEASCIGTDFSRANFTGATLEAWNIDSTTKLHNSHCDYVYLLRNQQERRPNSGIFGPGEFAKLFQEVLDTIDLIFRNGVDWRAFLQTLNQVQQKYENADLAIQSIENKGDGVVVAKLNAAPGVDKPAIHESFTEIYQRAFEEAEAQYKAQLHAKDSEIQIYRQQSADMVEILKLQAQRPIINQATAESRAMQGSDYSQHNQYGDNSNIVNQYGDGNTANQKLQQVTPPPPETVNIQAELLALHDLLAALNDPVTDGIAQKLEIEAQKPEPNKDVVGQTLETGLTYAKNLQGFAEAIDQLRPHVQNAAGWLGKNWYKLLTLVGLAAL